jgi:hypothetical protein
MNGSFSSMLSLFVFVTWEIHLKSKQKAAGAATARGKSILQFPAEEAMTICTNIAAVCSQVSEPLLNIRALLSLLTQLKDIQLQNLSFPSEI